MTCPCEHPCHPVDCCGDCHAVIGPWCADWEPSPRRIEIDVTDNCDCTQGCCRHEIFDVKDIAHLAQILRDARPDPYTNKTSFLLGWDAAIAALERMK